MNLKLLTLVAAVSVLFSGCYVSQNWNSRKLLRSFREFKSGELSKNDVLKRFGDPDGPFDSNEWLYKSKFSNPVGFRFGADSKMTEMNVSGNWKPCRRTFGNSVPGSPQGRSANQGFAGPVPTFADPRSNSQMNEALKKHMPPGFADMVKNSLNTSDTESSRDINKWCKMVADLELGVVNKEDIATKFGKASASNDSGWTYIIRSKEFTAPPVAMIYFRFGDDSRLLGVKVTKSQDWTSTTTVYKKGEID
jgi:hypothetical protein